MNLIHTFVEERRLKGNAFISYYVVCSKFASTLYTSMFTTYGKETEGNRKYQSTYMTAFTSSYKQSVYFKEAFCLACCGFVLDFGLYMRQTSQQGTILVPGLVAPKLSHTWTSHPIFCPGHLVPSFIMGFNSLMLFFCVSKFTF